jgi:hypothetical protein
MANFEDQTRQNMSELQPEEVVVSMADWIAAHPRPVVDTRGQPVVASVRHGLPAPQASPGAIEAMRDWAFELDKQEDEYMYIPADQKHWAYSVTREVAGILKDEVVRRAHGRS